MLIPPCKRIVLGDYFMPSNGAVVNLTVQEEPVQMSNCSLPTNYWQTPINAMNVHNWYPLQGFTYRYRLQRCSGALYKISSNITHTPKTANPHNWTKPQPLRSTGGQFMDQQPTETTLHNSTNINLANCNKRLFYYTQFPGSSNNPVGNTCTIYGQEKQFGQMTQTMAAAVQHKQPLRRR
jgi:hypothetical protein